MNETRVEGDLVGAGLHVGIASALWNQAITDRLLDGAMRRCRQLGVHQVTVLTVPGALELPLAAKALVERGCDAVVAIGAVIRGDTDHYDIVVRESASGIARVSLESGVPVANSILALHDASQAADRAGEGAANKGFESAGSAVKLARALRELDEA